MGDVELGNVFYNILAKDLTGAGTSSAKGNFVAAGLAISAALTGVAVAADAFIDKNTKLMGSLETTSQETGISADALRSLTMNLANGKDTIEEVTATMDTLGKFGVTTADQINTAAQAALALGDANNTTGSDVANNVIPALQAYGLTVDDLGAKSDALTAITHSTKYGLDDITNILTRAAPTAAAAGLSFDDMTQMIEAMGLKGIPARNAVNLLNTNIKELAKANKDGKVTFEELTQKLGITSTTLTEATGKMNAAAGSTAAYNDIAQTHIGIMANMASWWEKTSLAVGDALTPYSGIFQTLTVIAPIMTAVNGLLMLNNTLNITGAIATQGAAAAQWLLNIALDANPIGLVVLAVAGLVAGIYFLDQQFHFIQPTIDFILGLFTRLWDVIQGVAGAIASIPGVGALISGIGSVAGMLASGGSAQPGQSYVVGERGPELFRPSTPGTVIPNSALANTTNNAGDTHNWQISINVSGAGKSGKDISKEIAASLRTEMRQRGIPTGG